MYLDGDAIAATIPHDGGRDLDKRLPDIHAEILRFLRANLSDGNDVILDYPVSDATRTYFVNGLENVAFAAHWFLLKPDIQKVLSASKSRPKLNNWEIERIKYHYSSDLMKTALATAIDSTSQTPDETAEQIYETIRN
jgi:hypothetical protein